MKFYTSHQIALHAAIVGHGFDQADFSFTKKKGRIIANHNHSEAKFSFFEKRVSQLDPVKMRILDQFSYEIIMDDNPPAHFPSWEVLLEQFNMWLSNLKEDL